MGAFSSKSFSLESDVKDLEEIDDNIVIPNHNRDAKQKHPKLILDIKPVKIIPIDPTNPTDGEQKDNTADDNNQKDPKLIPKKKKRKRKRKRTKRKKSKKNQSPKPKPDIQPVDDIKVYFKVLNDDQNYNAKILLPPPPGDDLVPIVNDKDNDQKDNVAKQKSADIVPVADDIKEKEFKELDISQYAVDYDHVNINIAEFSDSIKTTDDHKATKLIDIFNKINITNDQLALWANYGGSKLFASKQNAQTRFKTVIDYVETNVTCSAHIKTKLRVITKLIMEKGMDKSSEYIHILLLLASHGSVCNVMKEVAISDAYGIMTNKLDDIIKMQSLQQQIIKALRDYRVLLVEELFHKFKFSNNTHYIAGFHNELSPKIGLIAYNDPNISTPYRGNWKKNIDKRYFAEMYTKDNILNCIIKQISEKKISYQKIVKFFQDNCPSNMDKNEFLQKAINIDNGEINKKYLCWLLEKIKIFLIKTNDWKDIEKCWDDIK